MPSAVVVDASALVEYLFVTPRHAWVAARLEERDANLHVPALCDLEVVEAMRRVLRLGRASLPRVVEALTNYLDLPLTRHGHTALLARALELRDNLSAYDTAYVVLAERLHASLLTLDAGLASAARRHTALDVIAPA